MVSSFTRHLYRHRRVTPNSCVNSLTSSQVLRRSTVTRWNFREYRFRFTLQPFLCKVCPSWLSHFKGAVHCSTPRVNGPVSVPHNSAFNQATGLLPVAHDTTRSQLGPVCGILSTLNGFSTICSFPSVFWSRFVFWFNNFRTLDSMPLSSIPLIAWKLPLPAATDHSHDTHQE